MHNYLKKLERMQREGKFPIEKGKQYSAKIAHDDWCQTYNGGDCNCDPEISFVEVTAENSEKVAKKIVEDSKAFRDRSKKKVV